MGNRIGLFAAASRKTPSLLQPSLDGDLVQIKRLIGGFLATYTLSSDKGFPDTFLRSFVNEQDLSGNTALHGAVFRGHRDIVEFLLYCGASIELKNYLGCSSLWIAAGYGHLDIVSDLLQHLDCDEMRRNALLATNATGDTSLLAAASRGHDQVCVSLLEAAKNHGIEKDMKTQFNRNKDSPLSASMLAMEEPSVTLVNLLLNDSVINVPNASGSTPLLIACERNWTNLVQRLLKNGASVEVRDGRLGASPLAVAAFCGSLEVLQLLVDVHPELLNVPTDTASCTPLWLATRAGHTACVLALLDAGADPSLEDETGFRPCDIAEKYERKELVSIFTKHGQ